MLNNREIKVLHLEPTDVCQAACPLCARETDPLFNKQVQHHLTMDQILNVFSEKKIAGLDKMFMCGNYGDPAAGKHTLEIYKTFRQINPSIVLGMNTNGGIHSPAWWGTLGKLFGGIQDYVVFSIDGDSETNHIYRKNVTWDRVIKNAEAFIKAGGHAHWDMLVYKHNQHQVDKCEKLAKDLGFTWFRAKISKRKLADALEYPINWVHLTVNSGPIECYALKERSVYIDAQGRISPCCWIGSTQLVPINNLEEISVTWNTCNPNPVCATTCSKHATGTNFTNQWQREIALC